MDEKKFTVLLTDAQEVKIIECDPLKELFDIARRVIGCDWIELVEPDSYMNNGYLMLIDEEGKLRNQTPSINCIASDLYGSDRHGDPIVGNAVIVRANEDQLELLTDAEAKLLANGFNQKRDLAIEKISKAFGIRPVPDPSHDLPGTMRRQPCKNNGMER